MFDRIKRMFSRKAPPGDANITYEPPSSEDWKAGDLALCLRDDWGGKGAHWFPTPWPVAGTIYRVKTVEVVPCILNQRIHGEGLNLEGCPQWWSSHSFRKIKPDATACSAGFREAIKILTKRGVDA